MQKRPMHLSPANNRWRNRACFQIRRDRWNVSLKEQMRRPNLSSSCREWWSAVDGRRNYARRRRNSGKHPSLWGVVVNARCLSFQSRQYRPVLWYWMRACPASSRPYPAPLVEGIWRAASKYAGHLAIFWGRWCGFETYRAVRVRLVFLGLPTEQTGRPAFFLDHSFGSPSSNFRGNLFQMFFG